MAPVKLTDIAGVGPAAAKLLEAGGFKTVASIAAATPEQLSAVQGFGPARSQTVIKAAEGLMAGGPVKAAPKATPAKAAPKAAAPKAEDESEKSKKDTKGKKGKKDKKDKKSKDKKDKKPKDRKAKKDKKKKKK